MQILENFPKVKILVVGDVMLDRYWWGSVDRISPEAPVPVVRLEETSSAAGGAANVASNIAGLGAFPFLLSVVGDDEEAEIFPDILQKAGVSADYLIKIPGRRTTVKTRVIAHNQQVVRIDDETDASLPTEQAEMIWRKFLDVLETADLVIISDYAKGMLSVELIKRLITSANSADKMVLVDPKGKDYTKYKNSTLLTPNRFEAAQACNLEGSEEDFVERAGRELLAKLKSQALVITQGEKGMTPFEKARRPLHLPASTRNTYDVTGAGDTVIAALGVAVGAGGDFRQAAYLANIAAGLVVEEVGTSAAQLEDLKEALGEKLE